MRFLKDTFNELLTWKWLGFIVIVFLYFSRNKNNLYYAASYYNETINIWDLIIDIFSDSVFLFYFILPLTIFHSVVMSIQMVNSSILIRLSSYIGLLWYSVKTKLIFLTALTSLWIMVSLSLLNGIQFDLSWSSYAFSEVVLQNYSYLFSSSDNSPFIIVLFQLVLLISFFVFIHILNTAVYLIFQKQGVLIFSSTILYTLLLVSYKFIDSEAIWIKVENFLLLSYSYTTWNTIMIPLLSMGSLIIVTVFIVTLVKKSSTERLRYWLKKHYINMLYVIVCSLGVFAAHKQNISIERIGDLFFTSFYGNSSLGTTLSHYLFYCIVNFGLVYLVLLELKIQHHNIYYKLLRYGSYSKWLLSITSAFVFRLLILLTYLLALLLLIAVMSDITISWNIDSISSLNLGTLLYHYYVNGIAQLLVYFLLLFMVYWLWKDDAKILFVFVLLIGLGYINSQFNMFLPLALNSFGTIMNLQDSLKVTVVLVITMSFELLLVKMMFAMRRG